MQACIVAKIKKKKNDFYNLIINLGIIYTLFAEVCKGYVKNMSCL